MSYLEKLKKLYDSGKIKPGVHKVTIYHDAWCKTQKGGTTCNCSPDLRIVTQDGLDPKP